MGKIKMEKVKHFTMELPQVSKKIEKKEKQLDMDTIFDKSGDKVVKVAKKKKTKSKQDMDLSFYNARQKSYSKDMN
tara:strand:- start:493 stop:720 length:228 start_codon:yes stop_codon:yes gene_type:complete